MACARAGERSLNQPCAISNPQPAGATAASRQRAPRRFRGKPSGVRVLVTGATGLIGHRVATVLGQRGHEVVALVRDLQQSRPLLPGIALAVGDVTDRASVDAAMCDIDWVFHAAGMPEQWQKDPQVFDRINTGGTANVLGAALAAGVKRAVYTSTMDVFAAEPGGTLVETRLDHAPKPTAYERSKVAADREAERVRQQGLEVVHVCPSAVYGPSPVHVGLNGFFIKVLSGQMPLLPPGGVSILYVDGCAEAHVAAAERGVSGERYLVSDTYVGNRELAEEILTHADRRKVPRTAPAWLMRGLAAGSEGLAKLAGLPPLIATGQLAFLLWNVRVDASKARRELGFKPTSFGDGVASTVQFLRREGLVG